MPLERKIQISQARIIEWYKHWNGQVAVSFSGGKDSTVLLHLVRSVYPDAKAVFSNTGLEYPEIQKHVRSIENVDIVTPEMRFDQVISTYGYPLIGKEVAEAIYYARRIRSSKTDAERKYAKTNDPDRKMEKSKRTELTGERKKGSSQPANKQEGVLIDTSTARNRRTVLMGAWEPRENHIGGGGGPLQTEWKRMEFSGTRPAGVNRSEARRKQRERREEAEDPG